MNDRNGWRWNNESKNVITVSEFWILCTPVKLDGSWRNWMTRTRIQSALPVFAENRAGRGRQCAPVSPENCGSDHPPPPSASWSSSVPSKSEKITVMNILQSFFFVWKLILIWNIVFSQWPFYAIINIGVAIWIRTWANIFQEAKMWLLIVQESLSQLSQG